MGDPRHGASGAGTITVRVPIAFRRHCGRKTVTTRGSSPALAAGRFNVDSVLVKALTRSFRWRKLMESGIYGVVNEIAVAEKINASYVSRVLRLTLLAPDIVKAILDGRQPAEMTLAVLMKPFPVIWAEQTRTFVSR